MRGDRSRLRSGGYRLLGFAVWRGGRWYLRRRARSGRRVASLSLIGLSAVVGASGAARRSMHKRHGAGPTRP